MNTQTRITEKSTKKLSRKAWGTLICLTVCILSMVLQNLMLTSMGTVRMQKITTQSEIGYTLSGTLFIPKTASPENPAPAVVLTHGSWRSREVMSSYSMELSRRGYVVFSFDQYGHGESGNTPLTGYDMRHAFQFVCTLPYVDTGRIAATGHSSAGRSINYAFDMNAKAGGPQFAAIIPVDFEPDYKDADGNWYNKFGNVDYGVVASKYDDWFFSVKDTDGTWLNAPKDYIKTENARSFLNFGEDPSSLADEPEYGKIYTREIDGKETAHVIYQSNEIHPWSVLSPESCGHVIEFLNMVMPASNPLPASDQHGMLKEVISLAGLAALILFAINLTLLLIRHDWFDELAAEAPAAPAPCPSGATGKLMFFGFMLLGGLFAYLSLFPVMRPIYEIEPANLPAVLPQGQTLCIGVWSAVCGLFNILIMAAVYHFYQKKQGMDLRACGIVMSGRKWVKTIALALLIVLATMLVIFAADYFCGAGFGFWVVMFKTFRAEKVLWMLFALPLFLLFYIPNSISVNCFNYNKIGGKEGVNTLINAAGNVFVLLIFEAVQYGTFVATGIPFWSKTSLERQIGSWLMGVVVILFVTPCIARKLYKETKNPYLGGILNGLLVTIMSVAFSAQYY